MKSNYKNIIIFIYGALLCCPLYSDEDLLQLPNIEEFVLNNGMRVLFSQNYDYPSVYCHIYINSGYLDDPQNGGILATVIKNSIDGATTKYSKEGEILELMQSLGDDGGRFDHKRMNKHSFEIGSYFLKEDIKLGLELYAELLQRPLYTRKNTFWAKLILPFIPKKNNNNKWSLTSLHRDHLYANIISSNDPTNYVKMTTVACKDWHNQHIRPENTTIMITGDVNYIYVKKIINNYFSNWKSIGEAPERAKYKINITDQINTKIRFINTDFNDAEIRIILKSASNEDEWYLSSELAKTIFHPGHSTGRLNAIHQKLNLYGEASQSTSTSARLPGTTISGKVKYGNIEKFYNLIVTEFNNLSSNSIDEAELKSAKKIISNRLKYELNEPRDLTHFIQREYNTNGYNLEKIRGTLKNLNDVSLDEVNRAAARIYNPDNFILLLMGKRDSCSTFLKQFENVEYYEHTEALRVSANSR
jgi:predicted Zn-dependent peptidase